MADSNEIKKDEATKQTSTGPTKSEKELSDADLEKAAGGRRGPHGHH